MRASGSAGLDDEASGRVARIAFWSFFVAYTVLTAILAVAYVAIVVVAQRVLDAVRRGVLEVLDGTLEPAHASVWLRESAP